MRARLYHVIVVNDRKCTKTRMTSEPVTHAEGCVILTKLCPHADTRALLEEEVA